MLLERRFLELRDQARRTEELLHRRVSSEEQREVLALLCRVHELEMENTEMQSHALLRDGVIRQKNFVVQRFEQHRHLCDEIIQQQRQFMDGESSRNSPAPCWQTQSTTLVVVPLVSLWDWSLLLPVTRMSCRCVADHRLLVPPRLQELYDVYMRELDERKLERAVALDKVTSRQTVQDGSLPKIPLHGHGRDNVQEVDSDQESVRNVSSDHRQAQTKVRRHTLPPILPEPEL